MLPKFLKAKVVEKTTQAQQPNLLANKPSLTNTALDKVLISGGDSFIYGLDLIDVPEGQWRPSNLTWPALLAEHLGRTYSCTAVPGLSNSAVARRVMLDCHRHRDQDIMVAVSWTYLNRYEFRFAYDPWLDQASKDTYGQWYSFNTQDLQNRPQSNHLRDVDPSTVKFIRDFYLHVGHDDIYEYYATLREIVQLQNYLQKAKIPYMFTLAHNFFFKDINDANISMLLDQIDWDHWYFFPPHQGFVQWAASENYPCRDEHPIETAHEMAATLIKEYLNV